jgi:hypothetical protein
MAEEAQENTAPEHTPIQAKALEQGWKPKEQFEGDEAEFIDAPEFVRRGELFGKIEHQSRELKSVKQALDALRVHNTKVEQAAYDRALKSLQDQRRSAMVEGETERAFALEDQIEDVKKEKERILRDVPKSFEPPQEFVEWQEKNSWYGKDRVMRAAADKLGTDLAAEGKSPAEVLKLVEKEIKEAFPHKFTNTNRERPGAVEASSRGGNSVARGSSSLSDDERSIMRKIVGTGIMTEKEYMDQLKKTKE